jgi:hypothetical protein
MHVYYFAVYVFLNEICSNDSENLNMCLFLMIFIFYTTFYFCFLLVPGTLTKPLKKTGRLPACHSKPKNVNFDI